MVQFKFDKSALMGLIDLVKSCRSNAASLQKNRCGIVDDWHLAAEIIQQYCAQLATENLTSVPFMQGPETFLDGNHHQHYKLDDGIEGLCVICQPKENRE